MTDTELTIHVSSERVASFYKWFGRWLENDDQVISVPQGTILPPAGRRWNVDADEAIAREVLRDLVAAQRELLAMLTDQPGVPVSWRTIVTRCGGTAAADVSQLVAGIAVASNSRNRLCPVRWLDAGDGAAYWLEYAASVLWTSALAPPQTDEDVVNADLPLNT
jgi:hypothetical protein